MSDAAAPAPAAVPDAEDQMAAELAALRQERASDGAAPAPAPSPAEVPAPADDAAAAAPVPSSDTGNTPTPAASPAPAAPAPAAATDPADQLKQLQTQLQQARSEIGRVGALNRELTLARQELATLKAAAPSAAQTADAGAAKAIEALEAKAKEFPELAPLLDSVTAALKATDAKVTATVQEKLAPVIDLQAEANQRQQAARAAAYEAEMATFQSTYPDAVTVLQGADFKAWLPTAPKLVQDAFRSGTTPSEALTVMDAYDAHLRRNGKESIAKYPTAATPAPAPAAAAPKPSNTARLDRAAGLPSRASGAKGGMPAEDDFDGSLEFFRRQRLANQQRAA